MNKRLIASMLLLSIAASAFSCGDANTSQDTTASDSEISTSAEASESKYVADVPNEKFGGYEFRFLSRSETIGKFWQKDIYAESENGDTLNDAVYKRNIAVEDALEIKITPIWVDAQDVRTTAQKSIMAGDDEFDIVLAPLNQLDMLAKADLVNDLYDVPNLDFSKPWWDQNSVRDLSYGNKLYYVYGDFTITDEEATWIVYFNKEIQRNLQMEDFYQLVYDGKWTNDKLHELSRKATYDLNGDGNLNPADDMYGYLGEAYNITVSLIASNALSIEKDDNDMPVMLSSTDRFFAAVESACEYMNDTSASMISIRDGLTDQERLDKYKSGQALFMMCGMVNVGVFRDLIADFGLLPAPKLDESQEGYYTTLSYTNGMALSVPKTNRDLDRTGIVLETFSAESKNILVPAYYEVALKRKGVRDDESSDMIDIIIEGRRYDIGMLINAGKIYSQVQQLVYDKKSDIASMYASLSSSMETELESAYTGEN